jgi:hypothetical protein
MHFEEENGDQLIHDYWSLFLNEDLHRRQEKKKMIGTILDCLMERAS